MATSKEEDTVQIEWHELLDRAQNMRSKASRFIFEQKRKAYIEKSVEIAEQDDDGAAGAAAATTTNDAK